ncbi:MAG: hypothetical protein J1E81_05990 [Eubacterium sp.]|nr:hypothetical protein [Eubacterium sp.]
MTFTVHITKRHVEGAGLHNEYYERYEDCDEDIEIEVDNKQVQEDIVDLIYSNFFKDKLKPFKNTPDFKELHKLIKEGIDLMIKDLDLFDTFAEIYHESLQEEYERENNDD